MVRAVALKRTRNSKKKVQQPPPWYQQLPCEIDAEAERIRQTAATAAVQAVEAAAAQAVDDLIGALH
jgi:hypothetical protein